MAGLPNNLGSEDGKPDKNDDEISNSLWGKNHFFDPRSEEDYEGAKREMEGLKRSSLSGWDALVSEEEREEIDKLDPQIKRKCPYLNRAKGSKYLFYCGGEAELLRKERKGIIKDTPRKPHRDELEFMCRCNSSKLEIFCLGDFEECSKYQEESR